MTRERDSASNFNIEVVYLFDEYAKELINCRSIDEEEIVNKKYDSQINFIENKYKTNFQEYLGKSKNLIMPFLERQRELLIIIVKITKKLRKLTNNPPNQGRRLKKKQKEFIFYFRAKFTIQAWRKKLFNSRL